MRFVLLMTVCLLTTACSSYWPESKTGWWGYNGGPGVGRSCNAEPKNEPGCKP